MPPWLAAIIGIIIDLIIGRILPASHATAQRRTRGERKLAQKIVQQFPEINFDCLLKVLPGLLDELSALAAAGKLTDPRAIANIVMRSLGQLIRCQFNLPQSTQSQAAINDKLISCGIAAVVTYFQTQDIGKALTGFITCVFSGISNPPGDGDDDDDTTQPPPGGGGNITPTEPVLRDHERCLS